MLKGRRENVSSNKRNDRSSFNKNNNRNDRSRSTQHQEKDTQRRMSPSPPRRTKFNDEKSELKRRNSDLSILDSKKRKSSSSKDKKDIASKTTERK